MRHVTQKTMRILQRIEAVYLRLIKTLPMWAWLSLAIIAVFAAIFVVYIGTVHADSQGPLSASSTSDCVDDNTGTIGSVTWTSPGNAFSSNNTYATASLGGSATSHYIKCTNFG